MQERFETFTVLINKISRNIRKIKNREMAEYGLRSNHISCLYYLYIEEELTATALCNRCEEDKATISRTLDHLEERGYISYGSNQAKRYKAPIALTRSGRELGETIAKKINYILDEVCIGLTESERPEFYRCLNIVSESLEKCANSPTASTDKTVENRK